MRQILQKAETPGDVSVHTQGNKYTWERGQRALGEEGNAGGTPALPGSTPETNQVCLSMVQRSPGSSRDSVRALRPAPPRLKPGLRSYAASGTPPGSSRDSVRALRPAPHPGSSRDSRSSYLI